MVRAAVAAVANVVAKVPAELFCRSVDTANVFAPVIVCAVPSTSAVSVTSGNVIVRAAVALVASCCRKRVVALLTRKLRR